MSNEQQPDLQNELRRAGWVAQAAGLTRRSAALRLTSKTVQFGRPRVLKGVPPRNTDPQVGFRAKRPPDLRLKTKMPRFENLDGPQ